MNQSGDDKIIYFIRHARDDSRFRGGWSRRPLIYSGFEQAKQLAEKIQENSMELNISTIITSDLPRVVQTARPVCQALGIKPMSKYRWREVNNGKLAGIPNKEAEELYPGMYWSSLEPNQRYPEGESPMVFFHRIRRAFMDLRESVLSGAVRSNVAVFTHSGVISVVYSLVNRTQWTNKDRSFNIPYTSVHAYNVIKGEITRIM